MLYFKKTKQLFSRFYNKMKINIFSEIRRIIVVYTFENEKKIKIHSEYKY